MMKKNTTAKKPVSDAQIDDTVTDTTIPESFNEHAEINENHNESLVDMVNDEVLSLKRENDEMSAKIKANKKRLKDLSKPTGSVTGPSKKSMMLQFLMDNPNMGLKAFVTHAMTEWDSSPIYANSCFKIARKG